MITHRPTSLADQIFERLENDILSGVYPKGTILTELALCEELGVSRTPVREVLKRLEQEHIVEDCGRGMLVLSITARDAEIIYEIREKIEGMAAAACAREIDAESIAALKEIVDLQDFYAQRGDSEKVKSLDSEFHKSIYRMSGSAAYYDTLMPLHTKTQKFRKATVESTGKAAQSAHEHRQVLDAIAAGDPERAEAAMTAHIHSAKTRLIEYLNQQEDAENRSDGE